MLRGETQKTWFSCLLRHPARKQSGPILTNPEPARSAYIRQGLSLRFNGHFPGELELADVS